ncbi:hypothetical protein VM1G_06222 [Cytospora mali]|uniref:Uncharacterized protein n=1 Tax=Cytospora mali TaxID=578113 RepID=A0A194W496_CYTMA|nr:hypothetical protein VM1G_06222 [Valsa mali]
MKPAIFAILVLALIVITYGMNISNLPLPLALALTLTLIPNATKTLESHNIWLPSPESFAAGPPDMIDNLNTTNCTVEAQKFVESGLDINDLVRVTIHATAATTEDDTEAVVVVVKSDSDGVKKDCGRCGTCQKVCFGTFWFLPLYAIVLEILSGQGDEAGDDNGKTKHKRVSKRWESEHVLAWYPPDVDC